METSIKSSSFAMPENVGIELCRVLGLAINNISVYGMEHSVTAASVASAYDDLLGKLDSYGEIEFVLGDAGLLINGSSILTERTTGQIFVTQLTKLGVHDFALKSPLDRKEFNTFFSILASAPGSDVVADGFEAAVAKAEFRCIRVTNVSYARVDKNADFDKMNFDDSGGGKTNCASKRTVGANTFELDMDLGFEDMGFDMPATEPAAVISDVASGVDACSGRYTEDNNSADHLQQKLIEAIKGTTGQATTLVGKVDSDRETIAQVEKDARAQGVGLNLSREELLENLAEINQELSQSLTVVSSVAEMLTNENIGTMNKAQQDILKVATDGIDKINKLVAYLGNLSGVPSSLFPDKEILDEAYGR